jgi:hypothetical protein
VATITDEFMREVLAKTRDYTLVFLRRTPKRQEPEAGAIIREHARRNLSLRADGRAEPGSVLTRAAGRPGGMRAGQAG